MKKETQQQKREREIRAMFYTVSARLRNPNNVMISDGPSSGEEIPYSRPERRLNFN